MTPQQLEQLWENPPITDRDRRPRPPGRPVVWTPRARAIWAGVKVAAFIALLLVLTGIAGRYGG